MRYGISIKLGPWMETGLIVATQSSCNKSRGEVLVQREIPSCLSATCCWSERALMTNSCNRDQEFHPQLHKKMNAHPAQVCLSVNICSAVISDHTDLSIWCDTLLSKTARPFYGFQNRFHNAAHFCKALTLPVKARMNLVLSYLLGE